MTMKCGILVALTTVMLGVLLVLLLRSHDQDGKSVSSGSNFVQPLTLSELDSHEDTVSGEERKLSVPDEQPSENLQKARSEIIRELTEKWQSILGNVDFSKKPLFNHMTYLHPQPVASIQPFEGVVLSEEIEREHVLWLNEFFQGSLLNNLLEISPNGYYLNDGRQESSFLRYEAEYKQNKITLLENGNLIFMTIMPISYDPSVGVTKEFLNTFLAENLRLNEDNMNKILEGHTPHSYLVEGVIFQSENAGNFVEYHDWQDQIMGFVGNSGVSVMLFKTDSEDKTIPFGIKFDFDWLNRGLFN
ncbi:MAG: hypothetical protein JW713_05785 [Pontiellaceae bacterium]|nr:hypothetical protein [Pontiellaceae bacterium]